MGPLIVNFSSSSVAMVAGTPGNPKPLVERNRESQERNPGNKSHLIWDFELRDMSSKNIED